MTEGNLSLASLSILALFDDDYAILYQRDKAKLGE